MLNFLKRHPYLLETHPEILTNVQNDAGLGKKAEAKKQD